MFIIYSQKHFIHLQNNPNMTSLMLFISHRINLIGRFKRFSLTKKITGIFHNMFKKQIIPAYIRVSDNRKTPTEVDLFHT